VDKNLVNHRPSLSNTTPKDNLNEATTFRNTVRPTTFRPNGAKSGNNNNINRDPVERDRNQLRRPLNEPSIVYDDEVGIGDIKLKNVEIHKVNSNSNGFVRRPVGPLGPVKQGQKFPSRHSGESFEHSGERRPLPVTKALS